MRDAKYIQKHRIPSQPLNFEITVHESAAKAVDVRKTATASVSNRRTPVMRARGRGVVRGTQSMSK